MVYVTDIFTLYVTVFIYILLDLYTNSHTSSALFELYEISHILYMNIPNSLSLDTNRV